MHVMKDLCYLIEDMVGRVTQKGDISPSEMDTIYKAIKTKYYITVMDAMEDAKYDDGYSGRRMMVSYDGHPYEPGGYSYRGRDSMGRYTSRDGGDMRAHLEAAMNMATSDSERNALRDLMNRL